MHYVISDIHGCYDKYMELMEMLNLSDEDTVYILGDIADRGPEPMKVFKDIMSRKNVVFMQGNHDYVFAWFISQIGLGMNIMKCTEEMREDYSSWVRGGGISTEEAFYYLPMEEKKRIIEYIEKAPIYVELEVDGKTYVLVHAGIQNYDPNKEMHEYEAADLLEGRTDYSEPLFEDESKILVTGHTPTFYFRPDAQPIVFIGNGHIAMDCGAVYGGKLAAYCFETKEVFYA